MPLDRQSDSAHDVAQREIVERHAAERGIDPYDLLIEWANEHAARLESAEAVARQYRASEQSCRSDAHRWYGRIPIEEVQVGATTWIYLITSNEGWEYVPYEVVGHGSKDGVPTLHLKHEDGEIRDWTPKPDLMVHVRRPL